MAILINKSGKTSDGRTIQNPIYGHYKFSGVRFGAGAINQGNFLSDGIPITNPYGVYTLQSSDFKVKGLNLIAKVRMAFYASKTDYDNQENEIPLTYVGSGNIVIKHLIDVSLPGPIPFNFSTGDMVEKVCDYLADKTRTSIEAKYPFLEFDDISTGDYNAKGTTIAAEVNFYQNKACKKLGQRLTIKEWEAFERNDVKIPTSSITNSVPGSNIITRGLQYFTLLSNIKLQQTIPEINELIDIVDVS